MRFVTRLAWSRACPDCCEEKTVVLSFVSASSPRLCAGTDTRCRTEVDLRTGAAEAAEVGAGARAANKSRSRAMHRQRGPLLLPTARPAARSSSSMGRRRRRHIFSRSMRLHSRASFRLTWCLRATLCQRRCSRRARSVLSVRCCVCDKRKVTDVVLVRSCAGASAALPASVRRSADDDGAAAVLPPATLGVRASSAAGSGVRAGVPPAAEDYSAARAADAAAEPDDSLREAHARARCLVASSSCSSDSIDTVTHEAAAGVALDVLSGVG